MGSEIAIRQTNVQDAVALQRVGDALFKSGLYQNAKNPFGAYAIVQYGHELGIGPMMSLQSINIIQGKPAASGQLMLSLAVSRGVTFQVEEETEERCVINFQRGATTYRAIFTLEDAKRAGLAGKDNWKKWPTEMLFWRAVAKGVRRIAPESVMGLYTPDEISNGDVIDVSHVQLPTASQQPEPAPARYDDYDMEGIAAAMQGYQSESEIVDFLAGLGIPQDHHQRPAIIAMYKGRVEEIKGTPPQADDQPTNDQPDPAAAAFVAQDAATGEQSHA